MTDTTGTHTEPQHPVELAGAARALTCGAPGEQFHALMQLSLRHPDRAWVEAQALHLTWHDHPDVQLGAAAALGLLGRIHHRVDLERVTEALSRLLVQETHAKIAAADALEDLRLHVPGAAPKDNPEWRRSLRRRRRFVRKATAAGWFITEETRADGSWWATARRDHEFVEQRWHTQTHQARPRYVSLGHMSRTLYDPTEADRVLRRTREQNERILYRRGLRPRPWSLWWPRKRR